MSALNRVHSADALGGGFPTNGGSLRLEFELSAGQLDDLAVLVAAKLGDAQPVSDGWLRGAAKIAEYVDAPVSRVYALTSAKRIPVERDGSNLIARRSDLDRWISEGGGKRP